MKETWTRCQKENFRNHLVRYPPVARDRGSHHSPTPERARRGPVMLAGLPLRCKACRGLNKTDMGSGSAGQRAVDTQPRDHAVTFSLNEQLLFSLMQEKSPPLPDSPSRLSHPFPNPPKHFQRPPPPLCTSGSISNPQTLERKSHKAETVSPAKFSQDQLRSSANSRRLIPLVRRPSPTWLGYDMMSSAPEGSCGRTGILVSRVPGCLPGSPSSAHPFLSPSADSFLPSSFCLFRQDARSAYWRPDRVPVTEQLRVGLQGGKPREASQRGWPGAFSQVWVEGRGRASQVLQPGSESHDDIEEKGRLTRQLCHREGCLSCARDLRGLQAGSTTGSLTQPRPAEENTGARRSGGLARAHGDSQRQVQARLGLCSLRSHGSRWSSATRPSGGCVVEGEHQLTYRGTRTGDRVLVQWPGQRRAGGSSQRGPHEA